MSNLKLIAPGERLKYIRSLIQFGREKLAKQVDIPSSTLRKWESGERGLSDQALKKCVEAYKSIGVIVSQEWIKSGEGNKPVVKEIPNRDHDFDTALNYLRQLHESSSTFFSYLDSEEKFQFISSKYDRIFRMPVSSIIGKPLKTLIGDESYSLQKPYLKRAYSGSTVSFEYPWKDGDKYRYLKLHYVPDITANGSVKGIFSFLEEVDVRDKDKEQSAIYKSKPDINEILPYVEQPNEYCQGLYFVVLEVTKGALESYAVSYDFDIITKIAANVYAHACQNKHKVSDKYLDKIIKVAIRAGVLFCPK